MPFEFDVKMDAKSLSGFVLYHNYMRPGGIIGILLSLVAIGALIIRWDVWTGVQRCLLVVLALLFLIFQPLMLLQKANSQLHSPAFATPMHYRFDEEKFTIEQGGRSEEFAYADIRKAVFHKNVAYLYMTAVSAFIIPRSRCEADFDSIRERVRAARRV
ncbi:MAG: YcxB family protein [Eubacterium sp.]|nr:YcxB family protein [Eubacterium sp.]